MGNANETYSAIFDLFTYWGYSMEAEPGKTLGEILQEALDTGNSSEIYYQTLNDAIKRYPELANAEFKSPSWQQGGRYHSETYACVFELPNGDKYVAYRGTDDGGWIDNGQGMTQESTLLQREASDYFDQMYEYAIKLIKKGKAYVCDLTADQIREYRGTLTEPGKESPYRNRSVEENLQLFEEMKEGKYADGEKVLRAKIDMASPNMNMRDPVIYRVAHMTHHRTGDTWCIYPMYDFAHPIEDAIEGITHSICTLEFEDHRPLYDWVVRECGFENPPRQIEFAKLYLTNVVTGKRYIKKLVEDGIVDGWDDPRLVTIAALRRRGYTPESLRMFVDLVGVSKANSSVDYAMLEYCIREDLKLKRPRMMAILDPVILVIDIYPEVQTYMLSVPNILEIPEMGERQVPFSRELYIEREDFMEEPPKKYFRLFPGNEVRLMSAYFVTCTSFEKDENGKVTVVHCTYDPETKSGSGINGRKVKGTIHWVSAEHAGQVECRLYENIVDEEKGKLIADGTLNLNPNSNTVTMAYVEPALMEARAYDSFQFVRNGFYCVDCKDSEEGKPVYNRIVSLKSSFRLPK